MDDNPHEKSDPQAEPSGNPLDAAEQARFCRAAEDFQKIMTQGNSEQAEAAGLEMMAIASHLAEANPLPDDCLENRLHAALTGFDWDEVIRLQLVLVDQERQIEDSLILSFHLAKLAGHYLRLGRLQEALKTAEEAIDDATRLEMGVVAVWGSELAARCSLRLRQPEAALSYVSRIITVIESSPDMPVSSSPAAIASLKLMRARCYLASDNLAAAEVDLAAAWKLIEPLSDSAILLGVQSCKADYFEIRGMLEVSRGSTRAAAERLEEAVEVRRTVVAQVHGEPHNTLYRLMQTLAEYERILTALGRTDHASAVQHEICALHRQLKLPAHF